MSVTTTVLLTSSFRPWKNMVSHFQRVTVTMFWLTTRYVHCIKTTHFVWANAGVKLWILNCLLRHLKFVEPKRWSTLVSETSKIITRIISVDTFHNQNLKSSTSVVTYLWKLLTGVVTRYFTRGSYFQHRVTVFYLGWISLERRWRETYQRSKMHCKLTGQFIESFIIWVNIEANAKSVL